MCCENHARQGFGAGDCGHHQGHGHCGCDCGCGGGCEGGFRRRFTTRAERIERLEEYRKTLEAELEGVKESLAEMNRAPRTKS